MSEETLQLQLKENWQKEKTELEERLLDIKTKAKSYIGGLYLVKTPLFEELKKLSNVLDGNFYDEENIPEYVQSSWRVQNSLKYICEHCKPKFPVIEFEGSPPCYDSIYFANPSSFSEISFYLTIDVPKTTILEKIKEFYNQIEKTGGSKEMNNLLDNWFQRMIKIIGLYEKEKFQSEIIKENTSYLSYICKNCEEAGIIEKMRRDTIKKYNQDLRKLGLQNSDYNLTLEINKKIQWS